MNLRTLQPRYCKVNFGGNIVRIVTFIATVVTLFCLHSQSNATYQANSRCKMMQNVSVPVLSRSAICLSLLDWPFTWLWPQVLDDIHCNENEDLTVASHMCCGLIVTSKHQKPIAFHMPVIWVGLQLLHTYVECLAFTSIHDDDVQRNSNARFKLLTPNCSTINDSCKLMHIQLLRWHVKGSTNKICISKPCFLHLSPWCPPSIAEIKTLYCPACVLHRRSVWIETFQNKLESVQTSQAINHQLHNDMWIMYMCKHKNLQ